MNKPLSGFGNFFSKIFKSFKSYDQISPTMTNLALYQEENPALELTEEILPTRSFVVGLNGFNREHSPSRTWNNGSLSTIRPNWTGITTYNGNRIVTHIAICYAITRMMFETTDSVLECMLNEDGGKVLAVTFSKRFDTEGIIDSLSNGSHSYFEYTEKKTIPPYEDVMGFPIVRERDIDSKSLDNKSSIVIHSLHTFKEVLDSSVYVPDEYSSYVELTPECRHFRNGYFF